jgi:hypothetical protein
MSESLDYLIKSVKAVRVLFGFSVTTSCQNRPRKQIVAGAVLVYFVAYCAAHVLRVNALEKALDAVMVVLAVLLYATLVSLPGIGIAYLIWKLSRNMRSILVQAIFRAGIFAIAITPAFWGHAGFLPAILLVFVLHGRDRLEVIIGILIVWASPFLCYLFVLATETTRQSPSINPTSRFHSNARGFDLCEK